jgi:hypothetical protein
MESYDGGYQPSARELHPYVAIGPTDDLSITVHKSTFDKLVMIFLIAFIIFVIILVIVLFVLASRRLQPQLRGPNDVMVDGDTRVSIAKLGVFNLLPNLSNKILYLMSEQGDLETAALWAQAQIRQSGRKDQRIFTWSYNRLEARAILWEMVEVEQMVTDYEPEVLYAAHVNHRWFLDRVFLAEFRQSMPKSYWKYADDIRYINLAKGQIAKVEWKAKVVGGDQRLTGIYANHSFTSEDISILLRRTPQANTRIYPPKVSGDSNIILPPDWAQYWVCYINAADYL